MRHDVIVIGLGAMGSAAAHRLAARGVRVLGFERFSPAHDRGSSHGGTRIIRQSYFEASAYVPLLRRTYELWAELEADTGRDLLTLTGGLYLGPPEGPTYAGSLLAAREWDLPHEVLDAAEIRRRFPNLRPADGTAGLYEERAGFLRPEEGVAAQLEMAKRHGADLRFGEPVLEWSGGDTGPARVRTATGAYEADRLVICPGAWALELLADLGVPMEVERQLQYWFQPVGGVAAFTPDRQPIYIWEETDGNQFYGFPAVDGPDGGIKVAVFRGGKISTADTLDRTVHPEEVAAVREILRKWVPDAAGTYLRGVACMYTNTPDLHFVVAPHPAHERVTVACGFSGHGYKFAPVIGEILADLACDGRTGHDVGLFDATRAFA